MSAADSAFGFRHSRSHSRSAFTFGIHVRLSAFGQRSASRSRAATALVARAGSWRPKCGARVWGAARAWCGMRLVCRTHRRMALGAHNGDSRLSTRDVTNLAADVNQSIVSDPIRAEADGLHLLEELEGALRLLRARARMRAHTESAYRPRGAAFSRAPAARVRALRGTPFSVRFFLRFMLPLL